MHENKRQTQQQETNNKSNKQQEQRQHKNNLRGPVYAIQAVLPLQTAFKQDRNPLGRAVSKVVLVAF